MHAGRTRSPHGFTLLELLVVVAVLAIVGGGLLVAYDDVDDMASEGVAAHTLASLDSAVRNYSVISRGAPNYLMVTGHIGTNWEAVYVIELGKRRLAAWRFDKSRKRLIQFRGRQLKKDFLRKSEDEDD